MIESIYIENGVGISDVVYFKDIKRLQILPYSTNTSIKKFCKAYNIPVLGKARKYVIAIQLFRACMETRIRDLKSVYGANYLDALKSEMNLYTKYKTVLEATKNEKDLKRVHKKSARKGKNEIEKQFLLDIENALEVASTK